jgi:AbrB family looped-hinge helix DNA binding protein
MPIRRGRRVAGVGRALRLHTASVRIVEVDGNHGTDMSTQSVKTRLNEDGRLLIPAGFRRALGLKPGQRVVLVLDDDTLRVSSVHRAVRRAQQLLRRHVPEGISLVDALIDDRRREAKRE